MKKLALPLLAAAFALCAAPSPLRAAYTLTLQQTGTSVVATGSGNLNLAALRQVGSGGAAFGIAPNEAFLSVGGQGSDVIYAGVSGPTSFGTGGLTFATSGTGNLTAISSGGQVVALNPGYVSGSPLFGTTTYDNATFASLGFTPGTYTYTWGTGANADSLTVTSVAVAPEPSTWALLALGLAGLGLNLRHCVPAATRA